MIPSERLTCISQGLSSRTAVVVAWLLAVVLLAPINTAQAQFEITDVRTSVRDERLNVNFDMDLVLSDEAEEALDRGIALIVSIRLAFGRDRLLIWNEPIARWGRDIEISYHALSERYLVQETGRGDIASFVTISDAMRAVGQGRSITIPVPELPTNADIRYQVELKAKLDIEALPTPLRLMAYLSPGWRLSTGSKKWPVPR